MLNNGILWQICKLITKIEIAIMNRNEQEATHFALEALNIVNEDPSIALYFNIPERLRVLGIQTEG